jgi:hypothetical protein
MEGDSVPRILVVLAAVCAVLAVSAAPAAADPFAAQFKQALRKSAPPCEEAFVCASGTVAGLGPATVYLTPTSPEPTEIGCSLFTGIARIVLADGSGTLELSATGTICFPGKSRAAPGGMRSFGNPFRLSLTFVVTGGTGVFAGAEGGGTASGQFAGAAFRLALTGDVG